jgi:1-aminocyclopropane-1-carboxylate deaminase
MLRYSQTPTQEIHDLAFDKAGVRVLIKREDLNHPYVSGNKWWKLKYNLEEAVKLGHTTLLTFGGAYSNHIYATANAAHELGLKSIGIIRGEETLPLNQTLSFAEMKGMKLRYMSREIYRVKAEQTFIDSLQKEFGDFYLIPEGGTNELAVKGVATFAKNLLTEVPFDVICLPVGTGGTMAGLIRGFKGEKNILGFSVLKGGDFLEEEIQKFLPIDYGNWRLSTSYHHGGYAKVNDELLNFILELKHANTIPAEPVYTGKLFWGVWKEIEVGRFKKGTTLLILHTGGLRA